MIECKFDIGDKIRHITTGDRYTIVGIVGMIECDKSSYYKVLSTYLTSHRIKFVTANKNFEKCDHNDKLEDIMQWVRE